MNVNNHLQGLQQLLSSQEVTKTAAARPGAAGQASAAPSGSDAATLSAAASLAARSAPDADVRMEKVSAVQQALASGNYKVPSSDVAGKMIDQMLGK